MRVGIRDEAALASVQPALLTSYLRSSGWRPGARVRDLATVWSRELADGDAVEVLIPLDRRAADFVRRVADALRALEIVEQRSQLDIMQDIGKVAADTVRVHVEGPAISDGTIPVDIAAQLLVCSRDLLLAAACATIDKRPVYPTRKPTLATEYLEKVRLSGTHRGSFVLDMESPVPPQLERDQGALFGPHIEALAPQPFERNVMLTLARALSEAKLAAEQAVSTGLVDAFFAAVTSGVNANLCEALAGLFQDRATTRISIGIHWSPTRPIFVTGTPSQVHFSDDLAPILKEAARLLKEHSPRADFEVTGFVIQLKRDEGEEIGTATIDGVVDGAVRKVRVPLGPDEYDVAIDAHRSEKRVCCEGELRREGKSFVLHNPRNFVVLDDDSTS